MSEEYKQLKEIMTDLKSDVQRGFKENREDHQKIKDKYVTNDRFEPVQKIVYGGVALILIAVVSTLIASIVRAAI